MAFRCLDLFPVRFVILSTIMSLVLAHILRNPYSKQQRIIIKFNKKFAQIVSLFKSPLQKNCQNAEIMEGTEIQKKYLQSIYLSDISILNLLWLAVHKFKKVQEENAPLSAWYACGGSITTQLYLFRIEN